MSSMNTNARNCNWSSMQFYVITRLLVAIVLVLNNILAYSFPIKKKKNYSHTSCLKNRLVDPINNYHDNYISGNDP